MTQNQTATPMTEAVESWEVREISVFDIPMPDPAIGKWYGIYGRWDPNEPRALLATAGLVGHQDNEDHANRIARLPALERDRAALIAVLDACVVAMSNELDATVEQTWVSKRPGSRYMVARNKALATLAQVRG